MDAGSREQAWRLGTRVCKITTINIHPAASWRTSALNNGSAGKVPFPGKSQPCCTAKELKNVLAARSHCWHYRCLELSSRANLTQQGRG